MDALATVLQELPTLSNEALREVRNRTQALLSLSTDAAPSTPSKGRKGSASAGGSLDYIYEGICFELRRRGLLKTKGIPQALWPKGYVNASNEIQEFFSLQFSAPLLVPQQLLLGRLAIEALANWLEEVDIPVGVSTLMQNVPKIPLALERSLPGYLGSGLLLVLLERRFSTDR